MIFAQNLYFWILVYTSNFRNALKCAYFCLWQHPDGILKMKKLRKFVLKAVQESGIAVDETELSEALEQKVSRSNWLCFGELIL